MDDQLISLNALFLTALFDQFLGQCRFFPVRYYPADNISAEDIEDDVEIIICPLYQPSELRYIPGLRLIGRCC